MKLIGIVQLAIPFVLLRDLDAFRVSLITVRFTTKELIMYLKVKYENLALLK